MTDTKVTKKKLEITIEELTRENHLLRNRIAELEKKQSSTPPSTLRSVNQRVNMNTSLLLEELDKHTPFTRIGCTHHGTVLSNKGGFCPLCAIEVVKESCK